MVQLLLLCLQFCTFLMLKECASIPPTVNRKELQMMRINITRCEKLNNANWSKPFRMGEKMFHTSQNFLSQEYVGYTGDLPVYLIFAAYNQLNMGNDIGRVINELGCAYKAGLHAIVINRRFDTHFADELPKVGSHFVHELSSVFVHPRPNSLEMAQSIVETQCTCNVFCWGHSDAPWIDFVLPLRDIFARALPSHAFQTPVLSSPAGSTPHVYSNNSISGVGNDNKDQVPSPGAALARATTITTSSQTHITTTVEEVLMDAVPDVAIQLRCSDNSPKMGLVPFQAIFDRVDRHYEYIKRSRTERSVLSAANDSARHVHIYIMSEHPDRTYGSKKLGHLCPHVLAALHMQLSRRYEDSLVSVVKGYMFRTWHQFMRAQVVICGASSFCLWPALANSNGTVYLPMTRVIANKTAVSFKDTSNVHFIEDYELFDIAAARTEKNPLVVVDALSSRSNTI